MSRPTITPNLGKTYVDHRRRQSSLTDLKCYMLLHFETRTTQSDCDRKL